MKLILLGIATAVAGMVSALTGFSESHSVGPTGGTLRLESPLSKIGVILVLAGVASSLLRAWNGQTTRGSEDVEEGGDDA